MRSRKGMEKALIIFAVIVLALLVTTVMVSFVSGFFNKTKEGQDKTFDP